jgi:MFS family permease
VTTAVQAAPPTIIDVLRKPAFRRLWMAQLVSITGSALTSLAAGILIYRLTNSALQVGLMLIVTALPSLLIGLISGVFVDRLDRKRIMVTADILRGLLVLLIPTLVAYNVNFLYLVVLLSSAIGTFFDPAFDSVIPEVATDEELAAANSLIAISSFGATAIGFAASGLIASQFSINTAFYIDALTFFFSAASIFTLHFKPLQVQGTTNVRTVAHNLREGFAFLRGAPALRSLLTLIIPLAFGFGLWNALLLPFTQRALHATEFEYGLQEGLTSVGFVLGSLFMSRYALRLREGQWIVFSFAAWGLIGALYSFSTSIPYAIFLVMFSGFLNAPSAISRRLIIQRNTQREVRGRVFSSFGTTFNLVMILGLAAAGLADSIDVRILVFIAALISLSCGVIAAFLPGLGVPGAEWRRATGLLHSISHAAGLLPGRPATVADLDSLVVQLPALHALSGTTLAHLVADMRYIEAPSGTVVVKRGDASDAAYFVLDGKAVAGREENGQTQILEVLNRGDFFGEIAALTGMPRTANVVIDEPAILLRVPSQTLKEMTKNPDLNRLFYSRMMERMIRMDMLDSPRVAIHDQKALRDLRQTTELPRLTAT